MSEKTVSVTLTAKQLVHIRVGILCRLDKLQQAMKGQCTNEQRDALETSYKECLDMMSNQGVLFKAAMDMDQSLISLRRE